MVKSGLQRHFALLRQSTNWARTSRAPLLYLMSYDSHRTQCDLFCDESAEVFSAMYDASTVCQDDADASVFPENPTVAYMLQTQESPSQTSSVVTEDIALAMTSGSDGSENSDDSGICRGCDGSGFPHEAEVPKDVDWKTENIAVTGGSFVVAIYQSVTLSMSMSNQMSCYYRKTRLCQSSLTVQHFPDCKNFWFH